MKRTAIGEYDDKYVAEVGDGKCSVFYKDTGKRVVEGFALPFDSIYAHMHGAINPCNVGFERRTRGMEGRSEYADSYADIPLRNIENYTEGAAAYLSGSATMFAKAFEATKHREEWKWKTP